MKSESVAARTRPLAPDPGSGCRIGVALRHTTMRRLVRDLLQHRTYCDVFELLGTNVARECRTATPPDLLVVDAADFPSCCRGMHARVPCGRCIVVGPEPDETHRKVTQLQGAGAWIPRERLGEDLVPEVHRLVDELVRDGNDTLGIQ